MAVQEVTKKIYASKSCYVQNGTNIRFDSSGKLSHNANIGNTKYTPFLQWDANSLKDIPDIADFKLYMYVIGSIVRSYFITDFYKVAGTWNIDTVTGTSIPTLINIKEFKYWWQDSGYKGFYSLPLSKQILLGGLSWNSDWDDYIQFTYGTNVSDNMKPYVMVTYNEDTDIDINVTGGDLSEDIVLSVLDATYLNIKAYQEGNLVAEKSARSSNVTFPSGSFTSTKDITFKATGYTSSIAFSGKNTISVSAPQCEIDNLSISGQSIDSSIVVTADATNHSSWTVQALQNNVIKATKTGTGAVNATFPQGSLVQGGNTTFRVTVSNIWNSDIVESTVLLSYTQASIAIIDLPGVAINTDENFKVAWVSNNQTRFKVELDGKTYEGTTAKSITIPKGVVSKGEKTIRVIIYYANAYYSNQASMETTFTSYGKPADPVITIPKLISSALPNITWESKEQEAYSVVIKKALNIVEKSENVISTAQYYKVKKPLENNTTYLVEVKIKNKYGLWSNTSKMDFTTQFSVPNKPTLAYTLTNEGSVVLNVSTSLTGDVEYKNTEIWKKEPYGEWKRMAYNLKAEDAWEDFYCGGEIEYQYKAINVGVSGGRIESDVIKAAAKVKFYTFYNVEDMYQNLTFKYDAKVTVTAIQNIAQNIFAGANAPMTESDGKIYFECEMQFSSRNNDDINRLLDLMTQAKLLLYKDCKGHKYFGKIINNPKFPRSDLGIITFNLSFCEEVFLEEDVYDGGNSGKLPLVWYGTWMFNGTRMYGGK